MTTVLIAHGSPDPRHEKAVADLASRVQGVTSHPTFHGFLEHNQPSVKQAIAMAAKHGTLINAVGLFLSSGHHAGVDVPEQITYAAVANVRSRGHLGIGPWLIPALTENLEKAISRKGSQPAGVVLVAAGSSDEGARAEVAALAKSWQRSRQGEVRPAFVSGPGPTIAEAIAQLADSASAEPALALLMLAPGVLVDRVIEQGMDYDVAVSDPLIKSARILDRIAELTSQP